jgi:hypothetical protein
MLPGHTMNRIGRLARAVKLGAGLLGRSKARKARTLCKESWLSPRMYSKLVKNAARSNEQVSGVEASPSFVREPEGNGVAAEFVAFARRYNETWLVARHGYKTPARVKEEQTMPPIDPTLAAALPLAA